MMCFTSPRLVKRHAARAAAVGCACADASLCELAAALTACSSGGVAVQVVGRLTKPSSFLRVVPDWKGPTSNGLYISLLSPTSVDKYMDKTYLGQLVVQSWAGSAKTLQILKTKQLALISPGVPAS
jgi:hypothetical protein